MKKAVFILCCFLVFVTHSVFAQFEKTYTPTNNVKINLASFMARTINISYEKQLTDHTSYQLIGFYTLRREDNYPNASGGEDVEGFSGYGGLAEYRLYPNRTGMDGFYIAPFFRYRAFPMWAYSTDNTGAYIYDVRGLYTQIGGGLILGRQWIIGDLISIDIFFGPGISQNRLKVSDGNLSQSTLLDVTNISLTGGTFARAGFRVGYLF